MDDDVRSIASACAPQASLACGVEVAGKDVVKGPNDAVYRPVGIAQAPDGSLVVTDDSKGRVWRISYTGRQ